MSSAQSSSAFAADAPRYGSEPAAAYYALHDGNGSTGVDSLVVGSSSLKGDVTLAAGTGITLTPAGNTVTVTASGAGVASVTGTANQIGATTTSGAVTLSFLPPSPAPTAGSYTSANITVDTFGRVTAAASGAGPLANVLYFDLSGGPIILPPGGTGAGQVALPTLTGLTVGKTYYMSLRLVVAAAPGFGGFSTGSLLRFQFQTVPSANAVPPRIYPANDATYDLTQIEDISFALLGVIMNGVTEGAKGVTISWSGIVKAQSTALSILCVNSSTTNITSTLNIAVGSSGGAQSYVQLQQLD